MTDVEVSCEHCGGVSRVPESLAGGIASCATCGRAVNVPGLRDPLWRALQALALLVLALATAVGWAAGGPAVAVIVFLAAAALLWLVSRAL